MEDHSKLNENKEKDHLKIGRNFKRKGKKLKNKAKITNTIIKSEINFNGKNENNKEIKKIRNPGVDLIRIIAMYNIVLNHVILFLVDIRVLAVVKGN